jgi:hypothetical protein
MKSQPPRPDRSIGATEVSIANAPPSPRKTGGPSPQTRLVYFEGYGKQMKPFLMILGFLSAVLIISQLVMGLLILQGQVSMRTAHQHSGYLTVAVTLVYIGWSLAAIASAPTRGAR